MAATAITAFIIARRYDVADAQTVWSRVDDYQ